MIQGQRIPMSDVELAAVDELIAAHADERISLTRRDPGETGPVLVHISDVTHEVAEDGTVTSP